MTTQHNNNITRKHVKIQTHTPPSILSSPNLPSKSVPEVEPGHIHFEEPPRAGDLQNSWQARLGQQAIVC